MNVTLVAATQADRTVLDNLFQYYLYEMSDFLSLSVGTHGRFSYNPAQIDHYLQRDDHYPFLIYADDELAGFSLLRRYPSEPDCYDIGQFFVLRKFKGQGVGRAAFNLSVSRFPGRWITRVLKENRAALRFWTAVVSEYTGGEYILQEENDVDLIMDFLRYSVVIEGGNI